MPLTAQTRQYSTLGELDESGVSYAYTPFDQGAMVDILDPTWKGACDILSHEWMLRKSSQVSMDSPAICEITNPFMPHPVAHANNDSEDTELIEEKFQETVGNFLYADATNFKQSSESGSGIEGLVKHIASKENHYGTVRVDFYLSDGSSFGHVLAFVKRGDKISFFDPNHGEITFNNAKDFEFWLKRETSEGMLKYLRDNIHLDINKHNLRDFFKQPKPSTANLDSVNPLERYIANHRQKVDQDRAEVGVTMVSQYKATSYHSAEYIAPDPSIAEANGEHLEPLPAMWHAIPDDMLNTLCLALSTDQIGQQNLMDSRHKAQFVLNRLGISVPENHIIHVDTIHLYLDENQAKLLADKYKSLSAPPPPSYPPPGSQEALKAQMAPFRKAADCPAILDIQKFLNNMTISYETEKQWAALVQVRDSLAEGKSLADAVNDAKNEYPQAMQCEEVESLLDALEGSVVKTIMS